jgi:hypothetical protein
MRYISFYVVLQNVEMVMVSDNLENKRAITMVEALI